MFGKRKRVAARVPDPPLPALARLDSVAAEIVELAKTMQDTVAELRAVEETGSHDRPAR